MTEAIANLKPAILALSEAVRVQLLGLLFDSLPTPRGVMSDTDPAFIAELDRRQAEFESGTDQGIPADEFFCRSRKEGLK